MEERREGRETHLDVHHRGRRRRRVGQCRSATIFIIIIGHGRRNESPAWAEQGLAGACGIPDIDEVGDGVEAIGLLDTALDVNFAGFVLPDIKYAFLIDLDMLFRAPHNHACSP